MDTQEIADVQALINIFFPFAEELIVKFGEFYPFAGASTTESDFVSVGFHEDNKHLAPDKVVANLKTALKKDSEKFIVTAVFFEVKTNDMETGETEDAIGVFVEHKNGASAYEFFYPYKMEAGDNLVVGDSYGNSVTKEIF